MLGTLIGDICVSSANIVYPMPLSPHGEVALTVGRCFDPECQVIKARGAWLLVTSRLLDEAVNV